MVLLEARAPISGSVYEVLIYGLPQDIPPLVGEVEHVVLLLLPPVIPPMLLNVSVMLLSINILPLSGDNTHTVFMDPNIIFHAIGMIDFINLVVNPVKLLPLVDVVYRLGAVICIPS